MLSLRKTCLESLLHRQPKACFFWRKKGESSPAAPSEEPQEIVIDNLEAPETELEKS